MRSRPHTVTSIAALAAAAALLLAGCSSPAESDPPAEEASTAADGGRVPAAEGAVTYPLVIETAWGETTLTERPERIVGLGPIDTELLVALEVAPVATSETIDRASWVTDAMPGEFETVYGWPGLPDGSADMEAIAASEPDLIVAYVREIGDLYDRLASIAPVLTYADAEDSGAFANWRTAIADVAAVLDLQGAAAAATQGYDEFFAQARAENPDFAGKTASLVLQYGEEYGTSYSSVPGSDQERLLIDLGFAPNPLAEQFSEGNDAVSPELIGQIDADVLIVASANSDPADVERLLTGTELFKRVGAVEAGNWAVFYGTEDGSGYVFDGVEHRGNINWAMAHGGAVIGKQWAAEQLIPILRSTLAGG